MGYIKVYTREPIKDIYPLSLANSVHFACSADGKEFQPLNQNYGMLFAEAAIRDDNTIAERGIRNPVLFYESGEYRILAEPVDADGNRVEEGWLLQWVTKDFVTFGRQEKVLCRMAEKEGRTESTGPEHNMKLAERIKLEMNTSLVGRTELAEKTNLERNAVLEVPDTLLEDIKNRWMPLQSVKVELPQGITLKDTEELSRVRVKVIYSDGSVDEKKVDWEKKEIQALGGGNYRVKGRIEPVRARFPLAVGYADPVVFHWKGAWYFLATNDNVNDIGMFVRKADSVDGLFEERCKEYCILDYNEEKGFVQTFWAPEFHVIGGELYILFAVSGKSWGPQCHMMRLKQNGEIICPSDWETPLRVCRQDGRPLTGDGITLDMTYFQAGGKAYLVWSYRYGIGSPRDSGSMLYIAAADEAKPWVLASEPVLLSRPLYGWENNSGTINNEGPSALLSGNKVYLAYSGGDACGYYYVVGYLTAFAEDDLLDVRSWQKQPAPAFSSASIDGIQGPGHNSFFRDEDGRLMIAYHAQEREKYFKRCTAMHRVHLSRNGMPMLNVAGERDVAEELREVELEFVLEHYI